MAFGQPSGPPASAKQIDELLTLLRAAGHTDFRDARGPMGFNQRQAGGRFTRDEAAALIERLQDEAGSAEPTAKLSADEQALRRLPANELAAELEGRGWIVIPP